MSEKLLLPWCGDLSSSSFGGMSSALSWKPPSELKSNFVQKYSYFTPPQFLEQYNEILPVATLTKTLVTFFKC